MSTVERPSSGYQNVNRREPRGPRPSGKGSAPPATPLSRTPGAALYRLIAEDLRARVRSGELMPDQRLDPESELARHYGVNRLTVRRALEELSRAGVLRTEHGVGSFVAVVPMRHRIDDGLASLSESMAARGLEVRHVVLGIEEHAPVPGAFPDFSGATVQFHFLRLLEGVPWSVGKVTVPRAIAPMDWDGTESVFATIGARHGLQVRRTERGFSAASASAAEAGWLGVPVGAALLVLRGINTDEQAREIAGVRHRIRGDRAEYVTRL